jgi:hypothetical protein
LKSLVFSSFSFFFASVSSSNSISLEVIETNLEPLYSLNHCTKNESIGSVNIITSIFFSLNCAKYGLDNASDSDFAII